jgi:hypothetical protein
MDIWYFINFIEKIMSMNLFYFFHGHFDISWIYVRKNVCGGTVIMIILFFWNLNFTNFHEKNTSMQLEFLIYFIFWFLMDIWHLTQFHMKTCLKNRLQNLYFNFKYFCHVASFILVFDIPICLLFESLNHESAP